MPHPCIDLIYFSIETSLLCRFRFFVGFPAQNSFLTPSHKKSDEKVHHTMNASYRCVGMFLYKFYLSIIWTSSTCVMPFMKVSQIFMQMLCYKLWNHILPKYNSAQHLALVPAYEHVVHQVDQSCAPRSAQHFCVVHWFWRRGLVRTTPAHNFSPHNVFTQAHSCAQLCAQGLRTTLRTALQSLVRTTRAHNTSPAAHKELGQI